MALKVSPRIIPIVCFNYPLIGTKKPSHKPLVGAISPFVVRGASGFTLIELVVTMAIVAILAVIATPSLRSVIQNGRIVGLTNDLLSDVNYARSEALKRATNVGICSSASGTACGGTWQDGYIVFADANNDGIFTPGAPPEEVVLRTRERLQSNTLTSAAPNPVIFGPRGLPVSVSAPGLTSYWPAPVSFSLCDDRGASKGRSITIDVTGRPSSSSSLGSC